jgi:RecA-family ATPase
MGRMSGLDDLKREAAQAQKEQQQAAELAVIRAASVKPERVKWLWPGRIPAGKVTMLDGDPGLGKSTITLDLTARLTTASPLPDGHRPAKPMGVFLLSAEDGVADTIVPRLKVAGANLELVTIVDHVADDAGPRPVELPADLDRIEKYAAALLYGDDDAEEWYTPGLLIVDPVMAYLGGEVNAHRDQDVRRVLHRLKLMAESTGMAVVAVRHLNKMTGSSALYRGGGSIGIIGAARAGLLVGVDPDDEGRRILAVSKSNLAAKPPSLAYRIVGAELYDTARVAWDGTSEHGAEDLLSRPAERAAPKQDAAEALLQEALAKGARPRAWIEQHAMRKGVSWRTVERAKAALEVIVERRGEPGKRGGGSYWWRLPEGQLSINSATTNTDAAGGLNEGGETAGQDPDSDSGANNSATPPQEEDHHDRHPPPGAQG